MVKFNSIFFLSFIILFGCKKKTDNIVEINVHVRNHMHLSQFSGLPNIRFEIIKRNKKNGLQELLWTGVTNSEGKLHHQLIDYSNENIEYFFNYERSKVAYVASGSSNPCSCAARIIVSEPSEKTLKKNEPNDLIITYAHLNPHKIMFVNDSCSGENDRFRFRRKYVNIKGDWTEWSSNHYGCTMSFDGGIVFYNDYMIYEYEVERNGIVNTYQSIKITNASVPDTIFY